MSTTTGSQNRTRRRKPPPKWKRVDPRPWTKTSAQWAHSSGWYLQHCGHPTALHPWALYDPDGRPVYTGAATASRDATHGTAWPCLSDAWEYVEVELLAARVRQLGRVVVGVSHAP